ncbi:MAG TPA: RidA family protein [Methylomirabilota bacterium]|nr:RidA family protein [Methylomirabilota bacterium]
MPTVVKPKSFGAPLGMYSHGMVAPGGEIVVVAGQVGMGAGGAVAVGDVGAQTRQALENVRAIVEAAGCTMRHVVRLQTFLTHAEDIPGFMAARAEVFPRYFPNGAYPPNTLLVVSRLVKPELLVEIEAMAVKPAAAKKARGRSAGRRPASRKR